MKLQDPIASAIAALVLTAKKERNRRHYETAKYFELIASELRKLRA